MVHFHRGIVHGRREASFLVGPIFAGCAPEHEPARCGPHLLLVALDSHEVPGAPGKNGFHGRVRLVVESVFQGGHGKARVVGVARFERAPASDLDLQRNFLVVNRDRAEREPHAAVSLAESGQAERRTAGPIARARLAEKLPARHRALQHASHLAGLLNGDGREGAGLVIDLGPVAKREVGEGAGAFEADHSGPHAAQGKGYAAEPLSGILPMVTGRRVACARRSAQFAAAAALAAAGTRQRGGHGSGRAGNQCLAASNRYCLVVVHRWVLLARKKRSMRWGSVFYSGLFAPLDRALLRARLPCRELLFHRWRQRAAGVALQKRFQLGDCHAALALGQGALGG